MMKKIILFLIILFSCSGCNSTENEILDETNMETSIFSNGYYFNCDVIENDGFIISDNLLIYNDTVYKIILSPDGNDLFSNNQQCIEAFKIDDFVIDNTSGIGPVFNINEKLYTYNGTQLNEFELTNTYLYFEGDNIYIYTSSSTYDELTHSYISTKYVLKEDGNVYKYVISIDDQSNLKSGFRSSF